MSGVTTQSAPKDQAMSAVRVLVVEDSQIWESFLINIIKRSLPANVSVTRVTDFYQFLRFIAERCRQLPDLVLVDLSLLRAIDNVGLSKRDWDAARIAGYRVLELLHEEFAATISVIICTETPAAVVHKEL